MMEAFLNNCLLLIRQGYTFLGVESPAVTYSEGSYQIGSSPYASVTCTEEEARTALLFYYEADEEAYEADYDYVMSKAQAPVFRPKHLFDIVLEQ